MRAGQTRHAIRNLAQRRFAEHPIRRLSAGAQHPLAYLFDGGYTGTICDGTLSSFFTDSAQTTPCVTAGVDPVGGIANLFGDDFSQTSNPNKCVYVENNGIKGFRAGNISGVDRAMLMPLSYGATAAPDGFTIVIVRKLYGAPTFWRLAQSTNLITPVVMYQGNAATNQYWYDNAQAQLALGNNVNTLGYEIFVGNQSVQGAWSSAIDGTNFNNANPGAVFTPSDLGTGDWWIGSNTYSGNNGEMDVYFVLGINRMLDATERDDVKAHIAATFGALT